MKNRKQTIAQHSADAKSSTPSSSLRRANGASLRRMRKLFSDPALGHLTLRQGQALAVLLGDDHFEHEVVTRAVSLLLPSSASVG